MTGGVTVENLYLDNMEATGFYRVALTEAQPGDVLLCSFGSSVPNHAAIYCGDGELLHHIPEQLSKRERYTDKWQRRTHSLWRHRAWHAYLSAGDLQRFGRRIDLRVKTGAEAIRALATQLPAFRQKLSDGWYEIRIAGRDTGENELSARLNEPLENGAVIHIVPRLAGAEKWRYFSGSAGGGADCGCMVEPCGLAGGRGCMGYVGGASVDPGRCCTDAGPQTQNPPNTDNG